MTALAPLALVPQERELLWGGNALVRRYGKHASPTATIGESWECFDGNAIASGAFAGRTLADVRAELGSALMGSIDPTAPFPLLTKIIDARQPLSVQVHPGDAYARTVEHQPCGKTECWYVLEAEPGATIVLGWNRDITRDEYLTRVRDGSLGELLREVPVRPGDVFHLPAGTMHAIGAGIVLFETQQTSDLTYRIFDYNRKGPDGNPRPLHVEKAADVLNYRASTGGALQHLTYEQAGLTRSVLVADTHFTVERITLQTHPCEIDLEGMPLVVFALKRSVRLAAGGVELRLQPYESAVVPAALGTLTVCSGGEEERAQIVTSAPPASPDAVARRAREANVDPDVVRAFVAQFA